MDFLYLMLLQGVNQLLPIVVMPYLMVKLGTSGYGYVGFSLSVIQYVTLIVDFGFNLSATKHVAQVAGNREELNRVFWNVVTAKLLLLLASTAVLLVLVCTVPTFSLYGRAIWATWPMVFGMTFTFMWFFQGVGKVRLFSIMNTLSKVALLPLVFLFVKTPDDYVIAAFLQAAVFVGTALITNLYLWKKRMVGWVCPTKAGVKTELERSFPLFLSTASTSVYTQLVVVVLGFFACVDEVGKYASAERIMRAVSFLLYVPLSQVFFPRVSALAHTDRAQALRIFRMVRVIIIGLMAVSGIALFVGGDYLPLLLGEDYEGINLYLQILALAPLAIGLGGVYGQMGMVALGNRRTEKRFRNVYFTAAVVAIVLMAVLVPVYLSTGACIVLMCTELLVAVLMVCNYYKYIR